MEPGPSAAVAEGGRDKTIPSGRTGVKAGLTRDRVVAAAIEEIDAKGLMAFSVRNVAMRLGVFPAAVYWHVPTREALLAEVVGTVLGTSSPALELDWRSYLRQLFQRYRDAIKVHPAVGPLVGAHLIGNSDIPFAFVEALLTKLAEAGYADDDLVHAYNAVVAALAGFVTQEFAPVPSDEEWAARVRARVDAIEPGEFPLLAANLSRMANHAFILRWESGATAPLDASFDRYVEVFVAGLDRSNR